MTQNDGFDNQKTKIAPSVTTQQSLPAKIKSDKAFDSHIKGKGNNDNDEPTDNHITFGYSKPPIYRNTILDNINTLGGKSNRQQPLVTLCVICELEMDTMYMDSSERLIHLQCGHICHEHCLIIELEMNDDLKYSSNSDREKLFPSCPICADQRCLPLNSNDLQTLILAAIGNKLQNYTVSDNLLENSPLTPDFAFDELNFMNQLNAINTPHLKIPTQEKTKEENCDIPRKSPKRDAESKAHLKQQSSIKKGHSRKQSRASMIAAVPLVISSASEQKIPTSLINTENWTNQYTLCELSEKLCNYLITLSEEDTIIANGIANFITMSNTLSSFGELRMADKLLAKGMDDDSFEWYYCFLFGSSILFLKEKTLMFTIMNISYLTYCEIEETSVLRIKPTRKSDVVWQLDSHIENLTSKWEMALKISSLVIESEFFTNTMKENEFDHYLKHKSKLTTGMLLPTGVNPRFYTGIIENINIVPKPKRIILVLNQFPYVSCTTLPMKNIIKALNIICIDLDLILVSSRSIKLDTSIISHHQLSHLDSYDKLEGFLNIIDDFESNFFDDKDDDEISNKTLEQSLLEVVHHSSDYTIDEIATILLSNGALHSLGPLPTKKNFKLEIGLSNENKSFRSDLFDLADWEQVMEIICECCCLEFDESDLEMSDDDCGTDILASSVESDSVVLSVLSAISPKDETTTSLRLHSSSSAYLSPPWLSTTDSAENLSEIIGLVDLELEKYA